MCGGRCGRCGRCRPTRVYKHRGSANGAICVRDRWCRTATATNISIVYFNPAPPPPLPPPPSRYHSNPGLINWHFTTVALLKIIRVARALTHNAARFRNALRDLGMEFNWNDCLRQPAINRSGLRVLLLNYLIM